MLKNKLKNSKSIEETNEILKGEHLPSYDDSFVISFRDRKKVYFTIKFGQLLSHNQLPYFSTSASEFNRNRTDYGSCGKSQESLIKNSYLKSFYKTWNNLHCKPLSKQQYDDLLFDIELLKSKLNYIESDKFNDKVKHDRELSN